MGYEEEEQSIIDDVTLSEAERKRALRDLYHEGIYQEGGCDSPSQFEPPY